MVLISAYMVVLVLYAVVETTTSQQLPSASDFKKPWFCHDLECPVYTVKETNNNFEIREYAPSEWIATRMSVVTYTDTNNRNMFYKLFHYISGNNSLHLKIAMTAPVLREVEQCIGLNCLSNHTTHFMIPFNLQKSPPAPTETGVFIRSLPTLTVYVRSYGGFNTASTEKQNYDTLVAHLRKANKVFNENRYYRAGYDGPYAFVRHNEIWIGAM